jgi:hypothetical protein
MSDNNNAGIGSADTSNTNTAQVTETASGQTQELPDDHPLVKKLEIQKAEIKDLKGKAAKLAEIEESQKSESEKAADRVTKAEAEVATVPSKVADALKTHLVALHKIDAEDAELFLTATEPDLLLKQITRLLDQADKRKNKNHVPAEGNNPNAGNTSDMRDFTRQVFGTNT